MAFNEKKMERNVNIFIPNIYKSIEPPQNNTANIPALLRMAMWILCLCSTAKSSTYQSKPSQKIVGKLVILIKKKGFNNHFDENNHSVLSEVL